MVITLPEVDLESFSIADVPRSPEPFLRVNRIPILENGEALVDLRETNPDLSFGSYCLPYVRKSVAMALAVAARKTPEHLDLRIYTALRTLDQQAEMYWHNYRKAREEHPDWPEATVRRVTNRFFAPPDAKAPPGHCTGAAVDIGLLLRETGEPIDVRSPLEGWRAAPTAVAGLSSEAAENRRLLCYIMHSAGLSNCRDEYWHWSYGDSAWAVRAGSSTACYGLIEPPENATRVDGPRIELRNYDEKWLAGFEAFRAALSSRLGDVVIEHVGSTSVPGSLAQPILDVVIAHPDSEQVRKVLTELGFSSDGGFLTDPTGLRFRARIDRTEIAIRDAAFRDLLRSNPAMAEEYSSIRARLSARFPWDRSRYDEGKRPFIESALRSLDLDPDSASAR